MYNMDISVFGYKINLEILILIGLIYLIMVGHTFCGCYNYGLMEGFTDASGNTIDVSGNLQERKENVEAKVANAKTNLAAQSAAGTATDATPVTSATTTTTEGFTGANINYGESSLYSLSQDDPVDTSSWSAQNMTVVPGQPLSAGVKAFLERKQQQLPLPEGEMNFFANSEFKPECCPSTYSTSTGCWCGTSKDYNYLVTRAGNNVPYSEY
jgi:hypothetical protein